MSVFFFFFFADFPPTFVLFKFRRQGKTSLRGKVNIKSFKKKTLLLTALGLSSVLREGFFLRFKEIGQVELFQKEAKFIDSRKIECLRHHTTSRSCGKKSNVFAKKNMSVFVAGFTSRKVVLRDRLLLRSSSCCSSAHTFHAHSQNPCRSHPNEG
jgi:hypothetical protein